MSVRLQIKLFLYSVGDDTIEQVPYIVCLNGRDPKMYDLWALNAQGFCEIRLFTQVRLFDNFREDTFKTFFFNSQRCRIPFVGRRSLKNSVVLLIDVDRKSVNQ